MTRECIHDGGRHADGSWGGCLLGREDAKCPAECKDRKVLKENEKREPKQAE